VCSQICNPSVVNSSVTIGMLYLISYLSCKYYCFQQPATWVLRFSHLLYFLFGTKSHGVLFLIMWYTALVLLSIYTSLIIWVLYLSALIIWVLYLSDFSSMHMCAYKFLRWLNITCLSCALLLSYRDERWHGIIQESIDWSFLCCWACETVPQTCSQSSRG